MPKLHALLESLRVGGIGGQLQELNETDSREFNDDDVKGFSLFEGTITKYLYV